MRRTILSIKTGLLAIVMSAGVISAQAQNTCATATVIAGNGTINAPGPSAGGGANNGDATNANWYSFVPTGCAGGTIDVTACPAAASDTRLWIYDGACGSLNQIGFNDDGCGYPPGSSEVLGLAVAGTVYIEWDDRWSTAAFDFDFTFTANPPTNTTCGAAISLPGAGTYTACPPSAGGGANNGDATNASWYSFDVTDCTGGTLGVTACPAASVDTRLWIYDGACGSLNQIGFNDDGCGYPPGSSVVGGLAVSLGTVYIEWDDRWSTSGFDFDLTYTPNAGPTNTTCATATNIGVGTHTACGPASGGGATNAGATNGEFYSFTVAECNGGLLDVSVCGLSTTDTRLYIYDGACGSLNQLGTSDDACGVPSELLGVAVNQGTVIIEWDDRWSTDGFDFSLAYTANPTNDVCANATVLPGTGTYTACGPTTGGNATNIVGGDAEFYTFTPPSGGLVDVSTCGLTSEDTRLWIYDGGCGALNQIASSDDDCGGPLQSDVTGLAVVAAQQIWIEWDDRWADGSFDFDFTFTVVLGPGEGCTSALPITTNGIYNAPAPAVGGGCENCGGATNATWYEFDVTDCDGGTIDITTCGLTSEDTRLWIYDGNCAALNQVAASDDDCGGPLQSDVTGLAVTQGTYYFEWDDRWATPLPFDFNFTYTANPLPTTCATATVIPANGIYNSCGPASGGGANQGDATNAEWWTYTAADDGTVNVLSCGYTTEDTRLWIYDGGCGALNQLAGSDDDCLGLLQSGVLGLAVTNGQQIWIEWDDRWSSAPFDFEFTFTSSNPTGDFCGDAIPITGNGTINAPGPIDGGGCENCGGSANATWYSFEVTDCVGGTMDVSACPAAASDTRLWIYDGSCGTLNQVASDDDGCGYPPGASEVTGLAVTPGFYYIEWDDRWSTADFDFDFTYTANTVPETCAQATVIPGPGTYSSCGPVSGGGANNGDATNADWWTYTATGPGIADVSACAAAATDTRLWIYDGGCGALNQIGADDDACGYPPGASEVTGIVMSIGDQIWIEWDDRWNSDPFDFDFIFTAGPPPTGWDCSDPIVVADTDLPYTHAGQNTAPYLDDYSTSPCSNFYIGGDDVIYTYTNGSGADQYIDVLAYNIAGTFAGLQILDDCPDVATTCIDQVQNGGSIADMSLTGVSVLDGETVHIVISSWPAPQSIGYDLDITIGVAPPAPPVNDVCSGAVTLAVGTNGDCPATGTFNQTGIVDASASPMSFTSCDNFGVNVDVFFEFVAPVGGAVEVNVTNVTATGTAEGALYDQCEPGETELDCNTSIDGYVFSGLTPGITYTLQIWYDTPANAGDFDICLQEPPGPPANDECAAAIPIACGATEAGTTSGATVGTDPTAFCGATAPTAPGVWYSVTGDGTTMSADLCNGNTAYDSKINVYSGTCGALVCVAGNDDACGLQSTATWASVLGTDYFILVNGFGGATGDFELTLTCTGPPANDECLGAIAVTCGSTTAGSTSGATFGTDPTGFCGITPGAPGVWYTITGDGSDITAETCNLATTYDTQINVYEGGCLGLTCVDGNDQFCGNQSSVTWSSVTGTDYFILVNGWNGDVGDFELDISCILPGDDPCAPIALTLGECAATYDNTGYTATGPTPASCWATGGSGTSGDIWFSFVAPTGGDVTIETFENGGSMTNTQIALYNDVSGTCPAPVFVEIDCDDDGGTLLMSQINATGLVAGSTYMIQVVGRTLIEGSFDISVIDNNAPLGDICSDAVPIFCNDTVSGTNLGAAVEPCTPLYSGAPDYVAPSVWYAYTETTTAQQITVTTCFAATDYDTRLSVLTGSCGALTPVVDNDDDNSCVDGGLLSTVVFNSVMGETYYIKVHGWGAFSDGNFDLSLICAPLCVPTAIGDDCASATNLPVYTSGTAVPLTHTNECALAGPQTTCEPFSATYDLWYEFTMPAGETDLIIQTPLGTAGSLNYALWDGCGGSQIGLCLNGVNGDQLIVGFTPGTQYWLQVWTDNIPDLGSYNISLELPPPPPTNDTTCLAIPLTVNAAATTATNAYATEDGPDLTSSCWTGASGLTQDVWFSFVAPGLGAVNIETFDNGGLSDTQLGLWEVSGCPGVPSYDNEVGCDDDGGAGFMSLIEATGLTPGATYYVQVSGWGGQFGEFQIRVTTPTPVAINEFPCNAFTLPVGGDCTYSTTSDNTGANEYITGSCGGNNGVWYHSVVPASGTLVINMLAGSATDAVLHAYTMTDCNDISTWTEIDCDDDDGQGFMSYLYLDGDQGLSPGDDVYFQVSSFSGFSTGDYQICATQGIVWSGASSNVYTLGSNWFHGGPAPLADENVIISPNATNPCSVTLPGGLADTMWVLTGATIDVVTGVELPISGDLVVGSTPQSFGPGAIRMDGAAPQQILTSPGGPLTFEELIIDNATGVTLSAISGVATVDVEGALRLDNGDFDVSAGDLTLVSNAAGQAYLDDWDDGGTEMTTGTITGNITVQRYVPGPGYHHIGPPVLNPPISQLGSSYSLIGTDGTFVTPIDGPACNDTTLEVGSAYAYTYNFDENGPFTGSGCTLWGYNIASSGPANSGEGIAATQVNPGDFTINWTGAVNGAPGIGTVSWGSGSLVNSGGDGNGFQLIANMFATPITWSGTATFPGAAYTWNDATGNYDSHPAFLNFPLAVGQGFFAQASGGTGSFELDNTDKLDNADPAFLRTSSVIGDYSLQLDVTGNGFTHFTVMAFANDLGGNTCTNGWDIACDAYALPGTTGQPFMYSSTTEAVMASPNRLQYNTQTTLDNATRSIPLSLDPGTNGTFTITASDLESFPVGTGIVLEDTKDGVMHDLNANASYTFTALASDYDPNNPTNRFIVHFSPASVTDIDNVIDITAGFYTAGDQLIMQLNVLEPIEGVFSVLNAVGQEVMSNDNITTINGRHTKDVSELANGVYVVRFVTENETFSGKFVKH